MGRFKVSHEKCSECLFSQQKIVGNARRKQIIQDCLRKDTYFVCHKGTLAGQDIACRGFFDIYKNDILITRVAQMFHEVEEVDVEQLKAGEEQDNG